MIHWQIPIYCAERIPLLDIYLFSVSLYPDSSSLSLFPVWHWSKFTKLIWLYFAICAQKPFFSTHLLESLSAMIWPSFRAVSSAACLSASACFNLHTQTKAGDTNMQNKKKKNNQNKLWQKHMLVYMCTSLYQRWNGTCWKIKMDKRTWCLKYNNLWKFKKKFLNTYGLRIDLKF